MGYNVQMDASEARKSDRSQTQNGGAEKSQKTAPMLAASFSGTPLLEETERRTSLLGPLVYLAVSPTNPNHPTSWPDFVFSPLPWATDAEGTPRGTRREAPSYLKLRRIE